MTKFALIVGGVVDTIAFQPAEGFVEVTDDVFGGYIARQDGAFSPPPHDDPQFPTLSGRQIRIALRSIGITSEMVEANISAAIADPLDLDLALIEWRNAGLYEFDHPMISEMAEAFALPDDQVQALWLWAAEL